jgi:putative membrane protein
VPDPADRDGAVDATRRTQLASERTYLAWWRSGLTALAVAFGVGRLLPDFAEGPTWPYAVLGAGFALLGLVFIGYGIVRERTVGRALAEGRFAPMGGVVPALLAALGVLLGIGTLLLVLTGP